MYSFSSTILFNFGEDAMLCQRLNYKLEEELDRHEWWEETRRFLSFGALVIGVVLVLAATFL